ncbi:MAG TPA: S9 family peptidase [Bryobacteraceae bacterium]|nr:S9 family peptidase [Bryobacteraceae bacterium]
MTTRIVCVFLSVLWLETSASAQNEPVTLEVAAAWQPASIVTPIWAPSGDRFVYEAGKRIRLYDCVRKQERVLASLSELEAKAKSSSNPAGAFQWENRRVLAGKPQWSPDGARILVAAGGDLFLVEAATGAIRQLTATPDNEEDPLLSPDGSHVGYRVANELYVLPVAGGKARRLTFDGGPVLWNGRLDWVYPEELAIPRAWWWSPDGREIAYLQFDVAAEMTHPQVDPGPVRAVLEPQRFPKAGTPNANVRLGVVPARGGRTRWMETGAGEDILLARVQWMPGGKELAVQRLNRVQDHLELLALDAATGKSRLLLEERDKTWINVHDILHFFGPGRFLWASERDGFRHLYLYSGGAARQLTSGAWEVTGLQGILGNEAWVTTTKDSPLGRQVHAVDLETGAIRRVTAAGGTHTVALSPGGTFFLDAWQSLTQPVRQTLRNRNGEELAVLKEHTPGPYALQPVENLSFRGRDGTLFYAQMIKPRGFVPGKKYPALVIVYGGPHAQKVQDTWTGANWDQALAGKGYVIWKLDNRGSNFRGHAFESAVYRELGRVELADQLEGVDYLVSQGFVDPARIGIYGWSYGGYMTLYAMTHAGNRFAAGIAGAPVTDWRHYDTIYTERYMGLPAKNEAGYKASSPIHSAANLEGKLLLVHNFQDDNVLFQNTQNMMEALQKAGKQFEMMFYPLKSHGVTGAYRLHMWQTMTSFLDRALQNKQ